MFEVKYTDLAGRIGVIETKHGRLETPALLPVIDVMRQEVPLTVIEELGYKAVITNSYLVYKRWGGNVKSIHDLLGFNGIVMTDSGAYQILEYGGIDIDQETILTYQKSLDVDIGVILDVPTGDSDHSTAMKTVKATLERAKEALSIIDPSGDDTIWVLPIQGGRYLDLIEFAVRESLKLPYRMYSLGSPTVFLEKYKYDVIGDMVYTARKTLPWGRPLHLFGAGHPLIIPYMVALGVDTFDSASYILYARDNRVITPTGVHKLEQLDYMPCSSSVCNKYTPKDLLELPRNERTKILAIHNLEVINAAIRGVKQAIRENRLWELLESFSTKHRASYELFRKFRKYHSMLDLYTPSTIPNPRGRRLISPRDLWNPIVTRHYRYMLLNHKPSSNTINLFPSSYELCGTISFGNDYVFLPFFGPVPVALCRSYPYSQHDTPSPPDETVCNTASQALTVFIVKNNVSRIRIFRCREIPCIWFILTRLRRIKGLDIECYD